MFELQSVALPHFGDGSVFVIDVGAIVRAVAETHPGADPWPLLAKAVERSQRPTIWIVAPTAAKCAFVDSVALNSAEQSIRALCPAGLVLRSAQAMGGLVAALSAPGSTDTKLTIVTAAIESHPYELWVLDRWAERAIDIVSGRNWTAQRVAKELGEPAILPELIAATGQEPAEGSLVSYSAEPRYRDAILKALESGQRPADAHVPNRVQRELQTLNQAIRLQARILKGARTLDRLAQKTLRNWLSGARRVAPSGTAYVVAETHDTGTSLRFVHVEVWENQNRAKAFGHAQCLGLLRALTSQRWFAPRALDMLATMASSGLKLPRCAVDPALAAFAFNPDYPPPLDELFEPWCACAADQRAWVGDVRRTTSPPTTTQGILPLLPALDAELQQRLQQEGLFQVSETDISLTLPILAKIERRGAVVGTPSKSSSWAALQSAVHARSQMLASQLSRLSPYDLSKVPWDIVKNYLAAICQLPRPYYHRNLDGEQYVQRLAAACLWQAQAVIELRSLSSEAGLLYWISKLAATSSPPSKLCGKHVPERTGRWGMATHPLQNIPKHSENGAELRSGLKPPKGMILLRADWNAFEARLIAELSGDPVLTQAANAQDLHAALSQQLNVSREEAKALVYALLYGQSEDSFFCSHPSLSLDQARQLYKSATAALKVAMSFLDVEERKQKDVQWLTTPAGFRRLPDRPSQARNFIVQGFGADCIRWVLRKLDQCLLPHKASVVHQSHDEVLVAVPKGIAALVKLVLKRVMTTDLVNSSGLFPSGTPMKVKITEAISW